MYRLSALLLVCSCLLSPPSEGSNELSSVSVRLEIDEDADPGQPPQDPRLRLRVREGYDAMNRGDLDQALQKFGASLRIDKNEANALFGIATVYTKLDDVERAITVYERLLEINPETFQVLNNMAWLYATTQNLAYRNPARAIELAQRALLIQPENFHVWSTLSAARYLNRDYERALRAALEAYRIAENGGLSGPALDVYSEQVVKCRTAMQAMMFVD